MVRSPSYHQFINADMAHDFNSILMVDIPLAPTLPHRSKLAYLRSLVESTIPRGASGCAYEITGYGGETDT